MTPQPKKKAAFKPFSGLSKDAPLWVQRLTSCMLLFVAYKSDLLSMPGLSEAHAERAGEWFDWLVKFLSFGVAMLGLFGSKQVKQAAKGTLLFLGFLLLSGCYTERKATGDVTRAYNRYEPIVADLCGKWYPPHDSISRERDSIYIQGKTKYLPGPVKYVNCDSGTNKGNARVPVDCPPSTDRVDTIRVKDKEFQWLVNRAKEQAQEQRIETLVAEKAELESDKCYLKYALWVLSGLFAASVALRLFKIW